MQTTGAKAKVCVGVERSVLVNSSLLLPLCSYPCFFYLFVPSSFRYLELHRCFPFFYLLSCRCCCSSLVSYVIRFFPSSSWRLHFSFKFFAAVPSPPIPRSSVRKEQGSESRRRHHGPRYLSTLYALPFKSLCSVTPTRYYLMQASSSLL